MIMVHSSDIDGRTSLELTRKLLYFREGRSNYQPVQTHIDTNMSSISGFAEVISYVGFLLPILF
jgi:hypothetical protein